MEQIQAFFVGYNTFTSQDKTKTFYIIQAMLQEVKKTSVKSVIKNVFVSEEQYYTIVNSLKCFDNITLTRTVNTDTDKVYYNLK